LLVGVGLRAEAFRHVLWYFEGAMDVIHIHAMPILWVVVVLLLLLVGWAGWKLARWLIASPD
jgi:hypothetical protein